MRLVVQEVEAVVEHCYFDIYPLFVESISITFVRESYYIEPVYVNEFMMEPSLVDSIETKAGIIL